MNSSNRISAVLDDIVSIEFDDDDDDDDTDDDDDDDDVRRISSDVNELSPEKKPKKKNQCH